MISVPNYSYAGREMVPSPFCPNSVHSRSVLTLTENEQRGVQRRIFHCLSWDREPNQRGCTSSSAMLTMAAPLELRFQPGTQLSSAQSGALKGVNGAGSCWSCLSPVSLWGQQWQGGPASCVRFIGEVTLLDKSCTL